MTLIFHKDTELEPMKYGVAPAAKKYVALWLYLIAAMVLSMVVIGGLTRLTDSGLSMVDWKPIMGVIPPSARGTGRQPSRSTGSFRNTRSITGK